MQVTTLESIADKLKHVNKLLDLTIYEEDQGHRIWLSGFITLALKYIIRELEKR